MDIIQTDTTKEVSDCFLESMSLTTNCSNTWNLSPKSFVIWHMLSHLSSLDSHFERFSIFDYGVRTIFDTSGYGSIPAISDDRKNFIFADGRILQSFGRLTSYAVVSKEPFHDFERYASSIYGILDELSRETDGKEEKLTIGQNLSFDMSKTVPSLDKKDTEFVLSHASDSVSGGLFLPSDAVKKNDSNAVKSSAIYDALSRKQDIVSVDGNSVLSSDGGIYLRRMPLSSSEGDTVVSCNEVSEAFSKKQNSITFVEPLSVDSNNVELLIAESASLNGRLPVMGGFLWEAIRQKEDRLSFCSPIAKFGKIITISFDGDAPPISSGEVFRLSETLARGLYSKAEKLSANNSFFDIETDYDNKKTDVSLKIAASVAENSAIPCDGNAIFEEIEKFQDSVNIDTKNSGLITSNGYFVSAAISSIEDFILNPNATASMRTSSLYRMLTTSDYLDIYDETLTVSKATSSKYGIAKTEITSSLESTDTLANSSFCEYLSEKQDCISVVRSQLNLQRNEETPDVISLRIANSISQGETKPVDSATVGHRFALTQPSSIAGSHVHISNENEITNDWQATPPTAEIDGNAGLYLITNTPLHGEDYDEQYSLYVPLVSTISSSLTSKEDNIHFNHSDFIDELTTSPHLCSFNNTFENYENFPNSVINGKSIYMALTSKQKKLYFDSESGFSVDGENIGINHTYLGSGINYPISGGSIYEYFESNLQKPIIFGDSAITTSDGVCKLVKFDNLHTDDSLPISGGWLYDSLLEKSPRILWSGNFDVVSLDKSTHVFLERGGISKQSDKFVMGGHMFTELSHKQDKFEHMYNVSIDENGNISKTDTTYELKHATISTFGGVKLAGNTISAGSSSVVEASVLHEALEDKQNVLNPKPEHFIRTVTGTTPPSTNISLNYGTLASNSEHPVSAFAFVEEISKKSNNILTAPANTFTIFPSSVDGHDATVISSTGVVYTPTHATSLKRGCVKQSSDGVNVVSSSNYVLRSKEIYNATKTPYSLWDYDSRELEILGSSSPQNIRPVYGSISFDNGWLVTGSSIYSKLLDYQDKLEFDRRQFIVTPYTYNGDNGRYAASSISVRVDLGPSLPSTQQAQGRGIYAAFNNAKYYYTQYYEDGFYSDVPPMYPCSVFVPLSRHSIFGGRNNRESLVLKIPSPSSGVSRNFSVFRTIEPTSMNTAKRDWFFEDSESDYSFVQSDPTMATPPNGQWSFLKSEKGAFFTADGNIGLKVYSSAQSKWLDTKLSSTTVLRPINGIAYGKVANGTEYFVVATSRPASSIIHTTSDLISNPATASWTSVSLANVSSNDICFDESSKNFIIAMSNGLKYTNNISTRNSLGGTGTEAWNSVYSDNECLFASKEGGGIYYFAKSTANIPITSYQMQQTDISSGIIHKICGGNGNYIALGESGKIYGCRPFRDQTKYAHWFEEYECTFDGQEDYEFKNSDVCFFNGRFYVILTYVQTSNIVDGGKAKYYVEIIRSEEDETVEVANSVGRVLWKDIYVLDNGTITKLFENGHKITVDVESGIDDVEKLEQFGFTEIRVTSWKVIHRFCGDIDKTEEDYSREKYLFHVDGQDSERFPCMPVAIAANDEEVMISTAFDFGGNDIGYAMLRGNMDFLHGTYNNDGSGNAYNFASHIEKSDEYQYYLYRFREMWDGSINAERKRIYKLHPDYESALGNVMARTVTRFDDDNLGNVGNYTFAYCNDLESVCVNNAISVGDAAFAHCSSIRSVRANMAESIGTCSFANVSGLGNLYFEKCKTIGASAFMNAHLSSVYIPSVTAIGENAFSGVTGDIYIPNKTVGSISSMAGFPWGAAYGAHFYGVGGLYLELGTFAPVWYVPNIPTRI